MPVSRTTRFAIIVIFVHLVLAGVHGVSHGFLDIILSAPQNFFVLIVIQIASLVAAVLLWRGRNRAGGLLLAASMAGALAFGVYFHFVRDTAYNVARVAENTRVALAITFQVTAVLLALIEVLGCYAGILAMRGREAGPHTR